PLGGAPRCCGPALLYFDVNRKVSRVPEGSWRDAEGVCAEGVCAGLSIRDAPPGSQTGRRDGRGISMT
ncbi:hypothetical protein KUDE01_023905, partial [Dissostichus eleginoides]